MTKAFRTPVAVAALMALSACGIFKHKPKGTPTTGKRMPILVSENAIETDKTIADVQVLLPTAETNDSWTQSGGNAAKSMGNLTLAATPEVRWTERIDGGSNRERLAATPVVADGKLFVTDVRANVHAYNAENGAQLWTQSIASDDANPHALFGGGVSYDDAHVYVTDGVGDVVALNAADGKQVWRSKPGGPLRGAPTVANGNVYVLSQDNQIFALGEADGKVQWTGNASLESQGVFGVAAPAASAGSVVAGFSSGELNAYRYENGRVLWQDALSRTSITTSVSSIADIDADPVIDNGRVYAVGQGGRMVALELSTGQRLWEQNIAGISTPWIAGEWLFVVADDARLICLSRSNGKARWIAQLPRFTNEKKQKGDQLTWHGPVLAGGRLVLTNSQGSIVYVTPADGTVAATVRNKKASYSLPPIVANGAMYTLDDSGRVQAWK